MDLHIGSLREANLWAKRSCSLFRTSPSFRTRCCREGQENGKGDRQSTDWDKAWSNFRKQGKKSLFSNFNIDKYVSWNPGRSEYPLSEELDPIKKTEKSNLILWTSPKFTLVGAVIVISLLLIYTLMAPMK